MSSSATKVWSVIQSNKELCNSSRMYFWIALNLGSKCSISDQNGTLSAFFSKYQREKYFSILVKEGWIHRADKNGSYFLVGFKTVLGLCGIACKEPRIKSLEIPEDAFLNKKNWYSFLVGEEIKNIVHHTRSNNKNSKHYSDDNNDTKRFVTGSAETVVSNAGVVQGLSLGLIAKSRSIHPSTASRWRKRGEIVGYKVVPAYMPVDLPGRSWEYLVRARDEMKGGNKLVIFQTKIYKQCPSLICIQVVKEVVAPVIVPAVPMVSVSEPMDILVEMEKYRFKLSDCAKCFN